MSDIYLGTLTALIGVIGTLTAIWFKYYLDREKNKHILLLIKPYGKMGSYWVNSKMS
jgi:hypothetical protein